MMASTSWRRKLAPFAVATAVIVGLGLIGWQAWEDFWDPPIQVDLDADSARDTMNSPIPPNFHFARGRKWPSAFAGTPSYAIRYDGPVDSYKSLRSTSIWDHYTEFKDTSCNKAELPRKEMDLDWLGLDCPPGTTLRIALTPGSTPETMLSKWPETALVLTRNGNVTQLFVLHTGT